MLAAGLLFLAVLGAVIAPRADEVGDAIERIGPGSFLLLSALSLGVLVLKTTAWSVALRAAGGQMRRPELEPVASTSYVVMLLNPYLGFATRVALLRKAAPDRAPTAPQLVAIETALLLIDLILAAIILVAASWTLDLSPPLIALISAIGLAAAVGLPLAARRFDPRGVAQGLAFARDHRTLALVTLILVASLAAQLVRTGIAFHEVGMDPDVLVVAAVVVLTGAGGALPIGTAASAAAAALIAAPGGSVALAAAAGVALGGTLIVSCLVYLALSPLPLLAGRFLQRAADNRA